MQGLLTDFLLPSLGVALGMTIFSFIIFYYSEKKNCKRQEEFHSTINSNNLELSKSVVKVDKSIEQGVFPRLDRIIDILDVDSINLSPESLKLVLSQIGINGTELSDDGNFLFFSLAINSGKYIFHLEVDTKHNNLCLEAYSREIKSIPSHVYEDILKLLDEHKTGAISIEVISDKKLIKVQDMIDCPNGKVNVETFKKTIGNILNIQTSINERLLKNKDYSAPIKFPETLHE